MLRPTVDPESAHKQKNFILGFAPDAATQLVKQITNFACDLMENKM